MTADTSVEVSKIQCDAPSRAENGEAAGELTLSAELSALADRLRDHRKLMWSGDVKPGVPKCQLVPLDLLNEVIGALTAAADYTHPSGGAIESYDDGSWVALSAWGGGAHPLGHWGWLQLAFHDADGSTRHRAYTAMVEA